MLLLEVRVLRRPLPTTAFFLLLRGQILRHPDERLSQPMSVDLRTDQRLHDKMTVSLTGTPGRDS
jgi:hypothetical protein